MDEDALAHTQLAAGKERVVRGDECFRQRARFFVAQLVRNAREIALGDHDEIGLRAARRDPANTLAHFPAAHFSADSFDFTGKLQSRNIRGITGRRGIFSGPLMQVRPVHARDANPHPHPIGGRCRWRV